MIATTTWNAATSDELENVTGGMMMPVHEKVEKELNKKIKGLGAGNLSDYVGEFGPQGRIPYIGAGL